jgi:Mg-chelatase subunit ChlD
MMKIYRFGEVVFVLAGLCLSLGITAMAQQNASSASVSRSRAIEASNPNPAPTGPAYSGPAYSGPAYYGQPAVSFRIPEEIAVEEFINYHKHQLPLPKAGQSVAMDTRWGNDEISPSQREAVLQIGFTTADLNERTDLRPLNLALVIDRSGSMADDNKMSRVKESLHTMLGKLRPDDIVSVVAFDSEAQVLYPAARIGDGYALRRAIDCIQPDGSTNLHAGLMLGYAEARKNFRRDATNRVILLTDGIANVGVTDPARIAADSSECSGSGIDLSTIGVGLDLNNDLLRTLAKSGHGLYHFISDYQDINKVFVEEVQSLVSSVAKRVEVKIEYDPRLQLEHVYGYNPRFERGAITIPLDNMNNGLTQLVMAKFRAPAQMTNLPPVKVRLSYFDVKRGRMTDEVQELGLTASRSESCDLLADAGVRKNYTIAELAQSLFDMTAFAKRHSFREAENVLNASVSTAYRRYPNMEDNDIRFILNIAEGYQRDLKAINGQTRNSDCRTCR